MIVNKKISEKKVVPNYLTRSDLTNSANLAGTIVCLKKIIAVAIFAITQQRNKLESCGFYHSVDK